MKTNCLNAGLLLIFPLLFGIYCLEHNTQDANVTWSDSHIPHCNYFFLFWQCAIFVFEQKSDLIQNSGLCNGTLSGKYKLVQPGFIGLGCNNRWLLLRVLVILGSWNLNPRNGCGTPSHPVDPARSNFKIHCWKHLPPISLSLSLLFLFLLWLKEEQVSDH